MFDEIKKSFGVSPAKAVTPPSPKMDDSDVEIVPPLDPAAYPAPPDSLVSPGPKPVKVSKIESYVFPRFDTVDTTAKKGTRDMLDAFADVWGSHPLVFMQPVPALTKLGSDGKPVDIGGARFKHAPASVGDDWMLPASSGRLGKVSLPPPHPPCHRSAGPPVRRSAAQWLSYLDKKSPQYEWI